MIRSIWIHQSSGIVAYFVFEIECARFQETDTLIILCIHGTIISFVAVEASKLSMIVQRLSV